MSRVENLNKGFFGEYGGSYVPEELKEVLNQVEKAFLELKNDPSFKEEFNYYLKNYVGRPSPLYFAEKLSNHLGGAKIYLKREDLNHTGSHKINNALGQALLAKRMGLKRIIAETGAGQHGVATATACALLGLECEVYMGEKDIARQALNVFRMELLGAKVHSVSRGGKTLKDAVDEALEDLVQNYDHTFYLLGSAVGPHPYPSIVKYFQSIIGKEARAQIHEIEAKNADLIVACVGGGSNAIGLFSAFLEDDVEIVGIEPGGKGISSGLHAAPLTKGVPSIIQGFKCYIVADENGQLAPSHSIAAGLNYPGVGPEHSYLKDINRAQYYPIEDQEALEAFKTLSTIEGIIPALESAHAVAYALKVAPTMSKDKIIIVNLSGRGDKDVQQLFEDTVGNK